jgi:hypothetical protein
MVFPHKLFGLKLVRLLFNDIFPKASSRRAMKAVLFETKQCINGKILDIVVSSKAAQIMACWIVNRESKVEIRLRGGRLRTKLIQSSVAVALVPHFVACAKI